MSDELKLKLVFDSSDAEKAAQALPDAVDRANRKGRKSWEGGGAPIGSGGDYAKMAGMEKEIAKQQEKNKKEENQRYLDSLKHNSQLTADEIANQEKERREKERIADRERKQQDADFKRRLVYNSRIQADQDNLARKEADRLARASDWSDSFVAAIGKVVVGGLLGGGVVGLGRAMIQKFEEQAQTTENVRSTQERTGMGARDVRMVRMLADNLTSGLDEDTAQAMAEEAYGKMRDFSLGLPVGGASIGLQAFGFDQEKFAKGEQGVTEILANMSDAYKEYGNSAKFAVQAESLFGKNWTQLRPILASGRRVITNDPMLGSVTATDLMNPQGLNTVNMQRAAHGLPPISSMMGGGTNSMLNQSLSSVTSLQAMGGGDILSAIARGPQDRIATATEQTATNTATIASAFGGKNYVAPFNPPAKLGR